MNRNHSFLESFVSTLCRIEGLFCQPTIVDSQFEWLEDLNGCVGKTLKLDNFCLGIKDADQCVFLQFFIHLYSISIVKTEIEEVSLVINGQI